MCSENQPYKTGFFRTLATGALFGAVIGMVELWTGVFGRWAEGREGALFLACTASGVALGLVASALMLLSERFTRLKSSVTFALVAIISGAVAGLVFGLVFGQKGDFWKSAIAGAVLVPILTFIEGVRSDDPESGA